MRNRTPSIMLIGALACFGGIGTLHQTAILTAFAFAGVVILLPIVALGVVLALLQLVTAVGLLRMDTWARTVGIATFVFVTVLNVLIVLFAEPTTSTVFQLPANVAAIVILYAKADAFGRGERKVDELSAHVGR